MLNVSKFLVALACVLTSCGYRPARPSFSRITVSAVTAEVPHPEIAACLTEELRLRLAARGVSVERGSELRLEGELLRVERGPGSVGLDDRPVALDQASHLVVRYRLAHRDRGILWGPANIRVERRAAFGPGARHSDAAADVALRAACREAAVRIVDELAIARPSGLVGSAE